MARAAGKGLLYFPKDVNYYQDDRIVDLLDEYGPLGQTIYDVLLSMVYREGYCLEMEPDRLARQITHWIGREWVGSREKVLEVLDFLAGVGLIDEGLYRQGVVTSAAIQRRYDEVAARRKTDRSKYWLLEQKPEGRADGCGDPAAEMQQNVADGTQNAAIAQQNVADGTPNAAIVQQNVAEGTQKDAGTAQRKEKERKENKTKGNERKEDRKKETEKKKSQISEREREREKTGAACRPPVPHSPAKRYGYYHNVLLTDAGYESLRSEMGRSLPTYIDKLSNYMEARGVDYPNHEATIRKWYSDDRLAGKVPRPPHQPSFDLAAFDAGGFDLPDIGEG